MIGFCASFPAFGTWAILDFVPGLGDVGVEEGDTKLQSNT